MKKHLAWKLAFLTFLILGTAFVLHRQGKKQLYLAQGQIFGTEYHIQYESDENLDTLILKELGAVDASLSMFNKNSTVTLINSNASNNTDPLFREVFNLSKKISPETQGAFDVTVAPLVNAWGFGFKHAANVNQHQIDSMLTFVGIDKVRLEGDRIVKDDPRVMFDFSSIAKGYGVDRVARMFLRHGVTNFLIEIGGEISLKGKHPSGRMWKVGVNKPVDDSNPDAGDVIQTFSITDAAMATSGNYRRFYFKNGKRYAHTIDPKTGMPVAHNILSATVITSDCATADAYATAFMVMGVDKAKEVLKKHPELMGYFIYDKGNGQMGTWMSPKLEKYAAKAGE